MGSVVASKGAGDLTLRTVGLEFGDCHQAADLDVQSPAHFAQGLQRDIPLATFDGAVVRPVHANVVRERVLAEAQCDSTFSSGGSEFSLNLRIVHVLTLVKLDFYGDAHICRLYICVTLPPISGEIAGNPRLRRHKDTR